MLQDHTMIPGLPRQDKIHTKDQYSFTTGQAVFLPPEKKHHDVGRIIPTLKVEMLRI